MVSCTVQLGYDQTGVLQTRDQIFPNTIPVLFTGAPVTLEPEFLVLAKVEPEIGFPQIAGRNVPEFIFPENYVFHKVYIWIIYSYLTYMFNLDKYFSNSGCIPL